MHIAAPHTLQYRQPLKQDLRLLQVDEDTLQQVLAGRCDGKQFSMATNIARRAAFKGTPDGEAVLCTSNATFAVKTVETTNSILLLPKNACISVDDEVCCVVHDDDHHLDA